MKNKTLCIALAVCVIISGCISEDNKEDRDVLSCSEDADCALGIRINACCDCPSVYTKKRIESDPTIVLYEQGKDYSDMIIANCENVICTPCKSVDVVVCSEGLCIKEPAKNESITSNKTTTIDLFSPPDTDIQPPSLPG